MPASPPPQATVDADLRAEYTGVEELLTERSIIVRTGDKLHRPAPGGEQPVCSAQSDEWHLVDTDNALRLGAIPCRGCYERAVEYLADEVEDNGVERREDTLTAATDTDGALDAIADGGAVLSPPDKLTSKPEEVAYATDSSNKTYHAPTADGVFCGHGGGLRVVDREVLAGQYRPCEDCFAVEAIDTDTP
jgi:hypothetical protein